MQLWGQMTADGVNGAVAAEAHRAVVRARILRGTRAELAARGLSVRVEDVAAAAGVSRRTVFRYFPTREALLVAALEDSMRSYGEHVPRPEADQSLEQWLGSAVVAVHRMNAQHGRVYFELASGPVFDGDLGQIARVRRVARRRLVERFTMTAWDLAGGSGAPPRWIHDTVAVLLSAFATEALGPDFGRTADQIGTSLTPALVHALRGAVADQQGG